MDHQQGMNLNTKITGYNSNQASTPQWKKPTELWCALAGFPHTRTAIIITIGLLRAEHRIFETYYEASDRLWGVLAVFGSTDGQKNQAALNSHGILSLNITALT